MSPIKKTYSNPNSYRNFPKVPTTPISLKSTPTTLVFPKVPTTPVSSKTPTTSVSKSGKESDANILEKRLQQSRNEYDEQLKQLKRKQLEQDAKLEAELYAEFEKLGNDKKKNKDKNTSRKCRNTSCVVSGGFGRGVSRGNKSNRNHMFNKRTTRRNRKG